ncbi:DUF2075 domain-containing protein [Lutibacter maritimus]|uniref:Uncharacterized conserved protein n=1 Tax=Lutibacter maritimus TaxID=593133 RepID=A0A1I6SQZ2_9FLAO|nr:DUF2075 domain-containing protein [Lutibacter maritimus]SFS79300.1 Uncharacterized conserved protein [Lutibacter maritimus]
MKRAYYSNSIKNFIKDDNSKILGELSLHHTHALEELQRNAWIAQIEILKDQLKEFPNGQVYFEFAIPRMGKRVDNIVIVNDVIFILEFKVGDNEYGNHAIEQVIDYTLDLKNFHEGSHHSKLIPVLISTNASKFENEQTYIDDLLTAARINKENLGEYLKHVAEQSNGENINWLEWETSIYKPTPTIIEAAQALYKGHNVQEISRSDAGAINLTKTADCLNNVVEFSKTNNKIAICFVTGVPGAGKTLAGLNIANERMKSDEDEHAVFLSGNGPLVEVLREALTRDEVATSKLNGKPLTKKQAAIKANSFIQNIHHFRDDNLISEKAPVEKVVVFDEAQRAWTKEKASSFMKIKKGKADFNMSEPEFLIDVMNRHKDWCVIICLIGGGQEINTGEAGLEEWVLALKEHYSEWDIHYSNLIIEDKNYLRDQSLIKWLNDNGESEKDLHLAVSVRSFRSEQLSNFVHKLLELDTVATKSLFEKIKNEYPIVVTRDLDIAKGWLRNQAKGSERIGLVGSSGARRLRPHSIDVKNEISPSDWFLNDENDIRSSYFLEVVATEFDIQGLEIDWVCLAWGANFHINSYNEWNYQKFSGTKWQSINQEVTKQYLINTYRVLLTRARQGMVLFIPEGSELDHTRLNEFYNGTYEYLKEIGIQELTKENFIEIKKEKYVVKTKTKTSTKQKNINSLDKELHYSIQEPKPNLFSTKVHNTPSSKNLSTEKIGKFVKRKMHELIENDLIDNNELIKLQNLDYCINTFHLRYPLLKKKLSTDPENILRYWKGSLNIRGNRYFICSEWYEQPDNNDRPYFEKWLNKIIIKHVNKKNPLDLTIAENQIEFARNYAMYKDSIDLPKEVNDQIDDFINDYNKGFTTNQETYNSILECIHQFIRSLKA